jgi:methyl-accepting chemotaxis protein
MQIFNRLLSYYLNLSIKTKLFLFVLCSSACLILASSMGVWSAYRISQGVGEAADSIKKISRYDGLKNDLLFLRIDLLHTLIYTDQQEVARSERGARQRMKSIEGGVDALSKRQLSSSEQELLTEFNEGFIAYRKEALRYLDMATAARENGKSPNQSPARDQLIHVAAPLFAAPRDAVTQLVEQNEIASSEMFQKDKAEYHKLVWLIALVALVSVALGLFFGWLISSRILRFIFTTSRVVQAVGQGDLSVTIPIESHDEMGRLAEGINAMIGQTRDVIGHISEQSVRIEKTSERIFTNAQQIATAGSEMAAQLNTVAVAAEEMNATSASIAESSQVTAESAGRVGISASNGGKIIKETITTMAAIAEQVQSNAATVSELGRRSDQIGDIVGTIEDIADQTNLLALNAAIEAARAGEYGRGFAVVADEVRKLAEHTGKSTREIGAMIRGIQQETQKVVTRMREEVEQVSRGSEVAGESDLAMLEISVAIEALETQVHQIATAAEEQSATTAEIAGNIQQVNHVVEGTAHQSQDSAQAAQELKELAVAHREIVNRFILAR